MNKLLFKSLVIVRFLKRDISTNFHISQTALHSWGPQCPLVAPIAVKPLFLNFGTIPPPTKTPCSHQN